MQRAKLPCLRASNPIIGPSLLQRASIQQTARAITQQQLHLNFADVARHHVLQYACCPARRRPQVHLRAGRSSRCSVTRFHCEAEHKARSLRWPKRDLHATEGWRGLMERVACRCTATREMQRALDEH